MHGNHFNLNAGRNPEPLPPPVHGYHIHIYFEAGKESEKTAEKIAESLKKISPDGIKEAYKIGTVGPHTQTNYAVHITKESFGDLVSWLQVNSSKLSILIHPETGDELKDHLESSMWLGKPVAYNDVFFAKLKAADKKRPPYPK